MYVCRKVSLVFVVAVLVPSICFPSGAEGSVLAWTLRQTNMQEEAGTGQFLYKKLPLNTFVNVDCREQSSVVGGDSWWLRGTAIGVDATGYVADIDMQCTNDTPAGHCDPAPHC